jgi:hypothetical protein
MSNAGMHLILLTAVILASANGDSKCAQESHLPALSSVAIESAPPREANLPHPFILTSLSRPSGIIHFHPSSKWDLLVSDKGNRSAADYVNMVNKIHPSWPEANRIDSTFSGGVALGWIGPANEGGIYHPPPHWISIILDKRSILRSLSSSLQLTYGESNPKDFCELRRFAHERDQIHVPPQIIDWSRTLFFAHHLETQEHYAVKGKDFWFEPEMKLDLKVQEYKESCASVSSMSEFFNFGIKYLTDFESTL